MKYNVPIPYNTIDQNDKYLLNMVTIPNVSLKLTIMANYNYVHTGGDAAGMVGDNVDNEIVAVRWND